MQAYIAEEPVARSTGDSGEVATGQPLLTHQFGYDSYLSSSTLWQLGDPAPGPWDLSPLEL